MPLTPINNPVLAMSVPELTTASVAHPDTFNPINQVLLNNDAALNNSIQAVDSKTKQMGDRIDGLEASSAVSVRKAVNLGWNYNNNPIIFELFDPAYTLIDTAPIKVVQGVKNDDSLDVVDTSKLKVGEYYLLNDPAAVDANGVAAPLTVMVQIAAVLSAARVRLTSSLLQAWGPTASLMRSTVKVLGAMNAAAVPGDSYLTRMINVGTDVEGGAVIIRRTLNTGVATLYYRDGYQAAWKAAGWSLRRTGGDIPAGFADYEYVLPMRGDGYLRLDFSGEPMAVQHVAVLGAPTGQGGYINPDQRPATPVNSTPANAATGVGERPSLSIAGYSSPVGNAQSAVQFQLATVSTFAQVLYDTGTLPAALSFSVPAGILAVSKLHYWRARVQDVAGLWSDWSPAFSFTTASSYVYVVTPTITGPAANATDVPEQPTVTFSAFAVAGGTDTQAASQLRIRSAGGTYASPVYDSGTDTVNKLSMVVPAGKLTAGQSVFFMQMRQQGSARGWSEWSPEIKITTKASFASVIGIALLANGGGSGTWSRVDENGVAKVTDASYFSSHPVYGAIQDVMIDSQAMVKIPAFYVKTGNIASGPNAGKRAWWISDQPLSGFALHPAFMSAGAAIAQYWVGKYQGTGDGTKLGSLPGSLPLAGLQAALLISRAAARNANGVTGFGVWNIYQLQAIQLLALIELGGADSQSLAGSGVVSGSATVNVDLAGATWRGVVGLWGNIAQLVDGLQTDASGYYKVWDKSGNKGYQTTTLLAPLSNGYPVSMGTDAAAAYDLSLGFLPATLDTTPANGTLPDSYIRGSVVNAFALHGGAYSSGSDAGLFSLNVFNSGTSNGPTMGARLAKV